MQEEILNIINQWNEKSLETLYRSFYKVAVSYACKMTGEQMIAEDVVQDVFLNLWEVKKTFNSVSHMRTYIIQCVHNHSIDKLRTIKNSSIREQKAFDLGEKEEQPSEEAILKEEVYQDLLFAIDALPSRQRELFLHLMKGKKNAEIAEAMNISLNTVKSLRKRGMDTLRKTLNPKSLALLCAILASA